MNDLQLETRVDELAARAAYTRPPISRIEGTSKEECIFYMPPGPLGPALFVHHHVDEKLPRPVQDFLIAQEFVQARLGVHEHRARIKRIEWLTTSAIILGATLLAAALAPDVAHGLMYGGFGAYLVLMLSHVLLVGTWSRWFVRRADRVLIDLLGRAHVVEALRWYVDSHRCRRNLRWLRNGAPPMATERLRWHG